MKTTYIFALAILPFLMFGKVQAQSYEQAMGQALGQMPNSGTAESWQASANAFERIAAVATDEWLPGYYQAFSILQQASKVQDIQEKDALLNKAEAVLDKQLEAFPKNSELLTLQGFRLILYVSANPMERGPQASGLALAKLQEAVQANPENPRAWLLLGQMQYGTAQFMQQPLTEACKSLTKAHELYTAQKSVERSLEPRWGAEGAAQMAAQCSAN